MFVGLWLNLNLWSLFAEFYLMNTNANFFGDKKIPSCPNVPFNLVRATNNAPPQSETSVASMWPEIGMN